MTTTPELREYATSVTASTIEMVNVTHALRDALTAALEDEDSCATAIQAAKETRDALIKDTYRIGLTPFMQPTAEDELEDELEDTPETEDAPEDAPKTEPTEDTPNTPQNPRKRRTPKTT